MKIQAIKNLLLKEGKRFFESKSSFEFSGVKKYDYILNDLNNYPHAFVLACIMDRQVKAEIAWAIPYYISQRLGTFLFSTLINLTESKCVALFNKPKPLHRFPNTMGRYFYSGIQQIKNEYGGDASCIWQGKPSSAEIVYRFLQFKGVGLKIATMATNILARDFKIPMSDYYSIDISPDVQVSRVFRRLGLISAEASVDELIYRARALNPEFPGLLDFPAWYIGSNWCRPRKPRCNECYMKMVCPSASIYS